MKRRDDTSESTSKLRSVTRVSLYELIVDQIKELIISGHLRPGDKLPSERQLAERFGASRHSIREALRVLGAMGVLETTPGGGTRIARQADFALNALTFTQMVQRDFRFSVLEVRKILEPEIAALAAVRASRKDIVELERMVVGMEERIAKGEGYIDVDLGFHLALVNATQNLILAKVINALGNLLILIPSTERETAQFHRRIYEAVRARDPAAAQAEMAKHREYIERKLVALTDGGLTGGQEATGGAGCANGALRQAIEKS